MKFLCTSKGLAKAILQVSKARSKKESDELLKDIYFELNDHQLILRSTNLDLFCEKAYNVKGIQNGKCLINGEIITKIAQTLSQIDKNIECEFLEGVFTILADKNVTRIKTSQLEEFPLLPKNGENVLTINKNTFIDFIRSVSFCASTSDIKPEIASVYVYSKENIMYAVSTDSFRLAEKQIAVNAGEFSVIIPQKYLNDLLSMLDNEDENIIISLSEGLIGIEHGDLNIMLRTVIGNYPDYKQLFPKEFTTKVTISHNDIKEVLQTSTIFAEKYSYIEIENDKDNNETNLQTEAEKLGSMFRSISSNIEGESIKSKYNSKYFLDGISHIKSDAIYLQYTTSNRPMFIKGVTDDSFVYLLMPLNR